MNENVKASAVSDILGHAQSGNRIDENEALRLLNVRGSDFHKVLAVADTVRQERVGDDVSYVINRNINFTNICIGSCGFCAFSVRQDDPEAYFLPVDEVVKRAIEARQIGATEIGLFSGLHPAVDGNTYVEILQAVKAAVPDIHIHALSPAEVAYGADKLGISYVDMLKMLKRAGLDSMPGTAAEILVDDVRKTLCPQKIDTQTWTDIIVSAHRFGIPTTCTMMYGHIESYEDVVNHLKLLRTVQDETGGFTEFVPLTFIHYNTPIFRAGIARPGATGREDLLIYAVGRLYLDNIPNIQVSWVKLGTKFAQIALMCGANDLGGTLMEENITRSAGGTAGQSLTPNDFIRLITDLGRIPRVRDTLYRTLSC
ncbi:MAG: 5-amino-6-(D-ribitylamino)uracil--L-tyrosine 4-hydroxyphenyl transferase CofH [Halobacteriota archaeon]|jgi:FO synthase subunit 2